MRLSKIGVVAVVGLILAPLPLVIVSPAIGGNTPAPGGNTPAPNFTGFWIYPSPPTFSANAFAEAVAIDPVYSEGAGPFDFDPPAGEGPVASTRSA